MNNNKNVVWAVIIIIIIIVLAIFAFARNGSVMSDNQAVVSDNTNTAANTGTSGTGGSGSNSGTVTAGTNPEFVFTDYTLRMGQVTMVDGVAITPLAVEQDSRCAANVQCIQAGTVRVSMKFVFNNVSTTKSLVSGNEITVDGVTGTIISVSPQKMTNRDIAPAEYSFVFRTKKKA